MQWAQAPQKREQIVLFTRRLDDVLPADDSARLLDEILSRIDWSAWEADYHTRRGQPAIHPRVLAGVLLHGLLMRIRSSRKLEEALSLRLDFVWLAEGRSIDHTTLSEFRRTHAEALKDLFVRIGVLARELKFLKLEQLAFDGTRIRANNRRRGTRTPQQLRDMKAELAEKFAELEAQAAAEDTRDEETFAGSGKAVPNELAETGRRMARVDAALAELKRVEQAGETTPSRVPLTDPESRYTPNKEAGFAPNYTPLATVDVESGMVVSADVIAMTNEDEHLIGAIEDVQESFGLEKPPGEMLADGLMNSGPVLAALNEKGVTLYSPPGTPDPASNPAVRDDLTQPVPREQWDDLPTRGKKAPKLDKSAFRYDAERDCYWCPQGKRLDYHDQSTDRLAGGQLVRKGRYKAQTEDCQGCPLKDRCLLGQSRQRRVTRDHHEEHREEHARRMATPEAKEKYAKRRHPGERPFAMIKQHFGARRFLLRGLDRVRTEWRWLATAFNLQRLMTLMRQKEQREARAGPKPA